MSASILAGLALVLAGAALHFVIGRASRRIPRLLARRRGLDLANPPGQRAFTLTALAAQGALWVGVAWLVSERVAPLMRGRNLVGELLAMSFSMPLFTIDAKPWTVVDLLALPALLGALWIAVSALVRVLRARVLTPAGVESGLQETVGVLLRYTLVFLGAIVVLQAWGVDVRSLAILGSVLGVGIGFGLQNIANNFVSGLLINVERPIRSGDFVNVGEFAGTVERVGARSTEVRTLDNVTILVPNSRFLESEVINWSHGDPLSRVHVPVRVAEGSEVARVRRALLDAARGHAAVVREPRPEVQLQRFGESSLDFELLVWTRDPRNQFRLASDLHFRIEEGLRRHGIAFPENHLHLRSLELERALSAWSRRVLGEGEGAAVEPTPREAMPPAEPSEPAEPFLHGDRGPEDWDDLEVDAVVARMRGPDGVQVRDRRHVFSVYPKSFVGHEAVEWLVKNEGLTHAEAVAFGERLVARGAVHHVLDEHGFQDGHFFYRFRDADPA